jgi:hypothetical protein
VPVTGGRAGAEAEAEGEAEETDTAEESEIEAEDRDKLVVEGFEAVVESPTPGIPIETEVSITWSDSVDETDEEIKPDTGFGSFGSIGAVGRAEAVPVDVVEPRHQHLLHKSPAIDNNLPVVYSLALEAEAEAESTRDTPLSET